MLSLKHLVFIISAVMVSEAFAAEVNIYSGRKEDLIKPLLDKFTAETGIKTNLVTAKADKLLTRLQSEGRNTPADVFITVDAGRLFRAKQADVFATVSSDKLNAAVPAHLRDPDGHWVGLSQRARVIFYAKDRVSPDELSTYEDLASDKWKNRICIRSSSNIYNQSLVAAMIAAHGADATQAWAEGLVKNMARPPKGGDRDQIKAAAAGQCDIAIANTYYFGTMIHAKDEKQREAADKVAIFWPNQAGRGTHVNVSGAAVTAAAPHRENAIRLLEFLAGDEAQQWYAETNHEYPVKPGVEWSDTLKAWGTFRSDSINLSLLGEMNPEAVKIMDRAGWK